MDQLTEHWELISLFMAFFGAFWAFAGVLLAQFEKRITGGFNALNQTLSIHIKEERTTFDQIRTLEREFLTMRGDLPLQYVRREDYVRNQSIIESKLDGLALRLENIHLRGKS
jgi:hypothetical protein